MNDLNLAQVIGLENVRHLGPSSIGADTLLQSEDKIPEEFLRGCGVPDGFITYLPSLLGSLQPIQFYSCFISHSSKDADFASRLHSRLRDEKLRVWFAPEDMKGGRTSREQIERAIHLHYKLLLVLSKASMGSPWVEHEIRYALEKEREEKRRVLFPIRICAWKLVKEWKCFDSDTGRDLARVVREYHIPDFSKWKDHDCFEAAFARLLADLKADESGCM
ncbi:MAG: toll/interleukin-1 receptor domain-containing protein [Isosphaeraceae bacterium]